jgi:hypothetical protein
MPRLNVDIPDALYERLCAETKEQDRSQRAIATIALQWYFEVLDDLCTRRSSASIPGTSGTAATPISRVTDAPAAGGELSPLAALRGQR